MPAKVDRITDRAARALEAWGGQIRDQRKALGVTAAAAAEAAGISRMTLHRIERGEASVTAGAYMAAATAVGLAQVPAAKAPDELPAAIPVSDYPELKRLAWHVNRKKTLTPAEAHGIYERNARHLDPARLEAREKELIDSLRSAFDKARRHV